MIVYTLLDHQDLGVSVWGSLTLLKEHLIELVNGTKFMPDEPIASWSGEDALFITEKDDGDDVTYFSAVPHTVRR